MFEKHRSQHAPIQGRSATAQISSTLKAIERLEAHRLPAPPRSSTWPEAVEKVRRRQMALHESATATSTPLSVPGGQSRTTAADAKPRRGSKRPSRTWAEIVEKLQRRKLALSEWAASSRSDNLPNPCKLLEHLQNANASQTIPLLLRAARKRAGCKFEPGRRGR